MLETTLHFADVHLESDAVVTKDTLKGIWGIIDEVCPTTLNKISFSGDVFDKAMVVPASKISLIIKFAGELLDFCEKWDIVLDFLEGTPSHDRKQSELFVDIAKLKGLSHRINYYPDLCIVICPRTGLSTMYIPDEWNHDNEVTLQQAQALLKKHSLTKVDMMSMHGAFKYQIGLILTRPHHLEQPWMDMCRYYIVIGHVHGQSTYGGIILVPGSTNRTAHNEERAKGAILTTVDTETGDKSWKTIANKHATIFATLDVRGKTLADVMDVMRGLTHPKGSNIRLLVNPEDPALPSFGAIKNLFPDYKVKRKIAEDKKAKEEADKLSFHSEVKGVSLTYHNIGSLLGEHLKDTLGVDAAAYMEILNEHVDKCQNGVRR